MEEEKEEDEARCWPRYDVKNVLQMKLAGAKRVLEDKYNEVVHLITFSNVL